MFIAMTPASNAPTASPVCKAAMMACTDRSTHDDHHVDDHNGDHDDDYNDDHVDDYNDDHDDDYNNNYDDAHASPLCKGSLQCSDGLHRYDQARSHKYIIITINIMKTTLLSMMMSTMLTTMLTTILTTMMTTMMITMSTEQLTVSASQPHVRPHSLSLSCINI